MTGSEQREAARQFINRWRGKGKEDEDGRSYWIELLSNVFGVENVTERIDFEKKVVVDGNTKRIDVYIPETRVIIEQKSLNIPLDKKIRNSGDIDLTPFEQADRYNSKLIFDERARWIVTCNFAGIWIYDKFHTANLRPTKSLGVREPRVWLSETKRKTPECSGVSFFRAGNSNSLTNAFHICVYVHLCVVPRYIASQHPWKQSQSLLQNTKETTAGHFRRSVFLLSGRIPGVRELLWKAASLSCGRYR